MSTDDDFTAYVGTHWSTLVRSALLLAGDEQRAESLVSAALVRSYQRWTRLWQDDHVDVDVLTHLFAGVYEPGRTWRGERAEPGVPVAPDASAPGEPELARAMSALDPLHRDVLVLRYVVGLDELQAAEVLDVRPPIVQQRLTDALALVALPLPQSERGDELR